MWVLIAAAVLWLGVSFGIYLGVFYNPKKKDLTYAVLTGPDYDPYREKMICLIDRAVQEPFEWVQTRGEDGTKLVGRLYLRDPSKPFRIEFHGYQGHAIRDFSGGLLFSLKQGYNVLSVDQRGQGRSGGHTMSFGIRERLDVPVWIRYVQDRFGENVPIWLDGISMGAATVLMASDMDLPGNIRGIWADCPYSDPLEIIRYVAKSRVPFAGVTEPFIRTAALLFGRFDLRKCAAIRTVPKAKYPIAIIHGNKDHFVPVEMSRALAKANPKIRYTEVENAPHGLSYIVDFEAYSRAFLQFAKETSPWPEEAETIPESTR